jgi:hypothetical protein
MRSTVFIHPRRSTAPGIDWGGKHRHYREQLAGDVEEKIAIKLFKGFFEEQIAGVAEVVLLTNSISLQTRFRYYNMI